MKRPPFFLSSCVLAASLPLGLGTACARLDMARAFDAERAATTIAYTGVREENRLYPDYGTITASVLANPTEEAKPPPEEKKPANKKGKGK